MDNIFQIIKRPLVTERSSNLKATANQYVFRVDANATKQSIKRAVQDIFKVNVLGVNTLRVRGKFRRMGKSRGGYRPEWKKAIVSVQPGQEIKALEEKSG